MKKVIRLTESDLTRIVKRVINEAGSPYDDYHREQMWNNPEPTPKPTKEDLENELNRILGRYTRGGMEDHDIYEVLSSWTENYNARSIRGKRK